MKIDKGLLIKILPPLFDNILTPIFARPDFSIYMEAYKPLFEGCEPIKNKKRNNQVYKINY